MIDKPRNHVLLTQPEGEKIWGGGQSVFCLELRPVSNEKSVNFTF